MRQINQIESNLVSGGGSIESYSELMTGDNLLTLAGGAILATLGAASGPAAQIPGNAAVWGVVGAAVTNFVLLPGYENGLLGDYLRGDICSLAKKLWPFERKSARRFLKN
jgi:hypothetical protein